MRSAFSSIRCDMAASRHEPNAIYFVAQRRQPNAIYFVAQRREPSGETFRNATTHRSDLAHPANNPQRGVESRWH